MKHNIIQTVLTFLLFSSSICYAQNKKVVICEIKEDIAPTTTRLLEKTLLAAQEAEADLVILDIDTYGGLLTDGDSMRKMILNSSIPVDVYINKNAASAGALISIACRNIYMGKGASIGSATVVTDDGSKAPDKYQSYMRSIMRSTAESHGKFTIVTQGDTVIKYRRNPDIAEAMVDHRIVIPGIVDSAQILAFSTEEAIANGYCEGEVSGISDILKANKLVNAKVIKIEKSTVDSIVGFLSSPGIRGALIMFIFWGIFFEIRTP
ncbi:MAG: membrane-bound serine protease (ClpP class), partial [Bacteroidia bacterium]